MTDTKEPDKFKNWNHYSLINIGQVNFRTLLLEAEVVAVMNAIIVL